MLLGIDPGYAKCGWSVVEPRTGRVLALGLIVTEQDKDADLSTDRARRVAQVGSELAEVVHMYGCTAIAAEQALGHGAAAAVAANQLPWGAVIMLAVTYGLGLMEVRAKCWQLAVLGIDKGKVDYDEVESQLAEYVGAQLADRLRSIKKADRNHALDAVGIGVLAALRPHLANVIVERRTTTFHMEHERGPNA